MNRNLNQYRSIQATTCDRGSLLLLLFDKTITEVQRARLAMGVDIQDRAIDMALLKAHLGVVELDKTLNHKVMPELAESLHKIYLHILLLLGDSLSLRQVEPLGRAERMLCELRETWREAAKAAQQSGVKAAAV